MSPHPLPNFEIQEFYQNESRFDIVYSRNNLSKIKDGTYVTNVGERKSTGAHWIVLYVNDDNVTYFDRFGVELIPKELKIYRKQKSANISQQTFSKNRPMIQ